MIPMISKMIPPLIKLTNKLLKDHLNISINFMIKLLNNLLFLQIYHKLLQNQFHKEKIMFYPKF